MRIDNDKEAISLIHLIRTGKIRSDKELSETICSLELYITNVTDILWECDSSMPDEQVLELAKVKSKPILL